MYPQPAVCYAISYSHTIQRHKCQNVPSRCHLGFNFSRCMILIRAPLFLNDSPVTNSLYEVRRFGYNNLIEPIRNRREIVLELSEGRRVWGRKISGTLVALLYAPCHPQSHLSRSNEVDGYVLQGFQFATVRADGSMLKLSSFSQKLPHREGYPPSPQLTSGMVRTLCGYIGPCGFRRTHPSLNS